MRRCCTTPTLLLIWTWLDLEFGTALSRVLLLWFLLDLISSSELIEAMTSERNSGLGGSPCPARTSNLGICAITPEYSLRSQIPVSLMNRGKSSLLRGPTAGGVLAIGEEPERAAVGPHRGRAPCWTLKTTATELLPQGQEKAGYHPPDVHHKTHLVAPSRVVTSPSETAPPASL